MSTKTKKVTYRDPTEENADYLIPSPDNSNLPLSSNQMKSSEKSSYKCPVGYYGSIYFPISLALYASVPVTQFLIGFIYIGQCTIRQFIFVYMILSGAFGIALVVVGLIIYYVKKTIKKPSSLSYDNSKSNPMILKILIPIFIILFLCVIGWFIAGQVIVFEVKLRVELFDPDLPEYCNKHLYKAAYILIFVDYLIILFVVIFGALSSMSSPEEMNKTKSKRQIRQTQK
ncbi:unnamed protein product [Rotaria sordida]|uniref:Uncharacterized protein n=1 Tax=Rotaria sordida TaxID=392033 RepID=A0A814F0S0_9BILA|nr:unnamed protein product [Rotaria sordida]CAF3923511.1 unnamed protein product [Rotaria sordida]